MSIPEDEDSPINHPPVPVGFYTSIHGSPRDGYSLTVYRQMATHGGRHAFLQPEVDRVEYETFEEVVEAAKAAVKNLGEKV